jgi:hypothetical protein
MSIRIQFDNSGNATMSDPDVPQTPAAAEAEATGPYAKIMDASATNAMLKAQSDAMSNPTREADDRREFGHKIAEYNTTLEIQESLIGGGRNAEARRYQETQQKRLHDIGILCKRLGIDFNEL